VRPKQQRRFAAIRAATMVKQASVSSDIDQLYASLDAKKAEWKNLAASCKVELLKVSPQEWNN
jgi:hypothetical protein